MNSEDGVQVNGEMTHMAIESIFYKNWQINLAVLDFRRDNSRESCENTVSKVNKR